MRRFAVSLLLGTALMITPAYAADLSDWAKSDYEIISKSGILTSEIASKNLRDPITREETAAMMVNFYTQLTEKEAVEGENPFSDTDNPYVIKAYNAGLVSGKGPNLFDPEGKLTRQEFAKMLLNTFNSAEIETGLENIDFDAVFDSFADSDEIAGWATDAFALALENGIINGLTKTKLSPKGNTTREQAVCIVSRAYKLYTEFQQSYPVPQLTSNTINNSGDMDFAWIGSNDAKKYFVILKDENNIITESFETKAPNATIYSVDYADGTYSITLGTEYKTGKQTFTEPMDFSFKQPIVATPVLPTDNLTLAQKEARVFPSGKAFSNADEAKQFMVKVSVPVWKIGSNGEKYSSTAYLDINSALADDVVAIFTEIFNSGEQFPIKSVGGYYWRNTAGGRLSQHSYGTCIDINPTENYYVTPSGKPIVGNYWKPYEDPYSIPEDGIVVKTFAKYGWEWGGNCWGAKYNKDYMHFTYLGK